MKTYWLKFGSGDPRSFTGLAPSFVLWYNRLGATMAAPGITEIYTGSGHYRFEYNPYSGPIAFIADGGATLSASGRYVTGGLDPADAIDELGASIYALDQAAFAVVASNNQQGSSIYALGLTNIAVSASLYAQGQTITSYVSTAGGYGATTYALVVGIDGKLGSTASSYGTTVAPVDIFGYVKRLREFLEGNAAFTKATGVWDIYSRGSSVLLVSKSLTNTATDANKS